MNYDALTTVDEIQAAFSENETLVMDYLKSLLETAANTPKDIEKLTSLSMEVFRTSYMRGLLSSLMMTATFEKGMKDKFDVLPYHIQITIDAEKKFIIDAIKKSETMISDFRNGL